MGEAGGDEQRGAELDREVADEMGARQCRQRPRSRRYETIGTLSYHAMPVPQLDALRAPARL